MNKPIPVRYNRIKLLERGDWVLYKRIHDDNYALAEVLETPWPCINVRITLLEPYNGNVNYGAGQHINAHIDEIFWSAQATIPVRRLERILGRRIPVGRLDDRVKFT